jgi:hypothetical protein
MIHRIKGIEVSPDNRFDIGVSIDFEARVDQQKMTTDTIVLSREGNDIVKDHIKNVGLLDGIPYEIEFAPQKTIQYFIDTTNQMKVYDNKVHVAVTNYLGHDQFFNRAEDLIWDLVNASNPIPAITINYQVVPQDANARALTCSVGLFTIGITIAKQSEEVSERWTDFIWAIYPLYGVSAGGVVIVTDWKTILIATAKLALALIFWAILAFEAVKLGIQLYRLINPPINKLQASKALHLLQNGCNHLGYQFESSILEGDYADMVILPIPQNRSNVKWYDVFSGDFGTGINKPYPQSSDTINTLGSLIFAMENMFSAKAKVKDGIVKLERWDYWKLQATQKINSSLVVQADRVNMFEYDFSKLFKRYYIHYLSDYSDKNTLDAFENNLAEYSLDFITPKNPKLNLIKGLQEKVIPFALTKRKEKLTWLESEFNKLYQLIDFLSLGETNLVAKKNKFGSIQITDPYFSTTKIFMWDKAHGARKDQTILTPTYLWDNFHYINQPDLYQYIIKRDVKIKISEAEFVDILDKNFVKIDYKLCEIIKIDYFDEKNYAIIDYKEPYNVFNNQFKLTKIY